MRPSIFGNEPRDPTGPLNNSRNAPAAPVAGIDNRLWCPTCRASLHKTRTPARCPECLQPLWIEVEVRP